MTTKSPSNLFICPFTIVRDQQEQFPYIFEGIPPRANQSGKKIVVRTETRHLQTADYSILGYEDRIVIERKSLVDLYGTLGKGHDRFEREFERMTQIEHASVVIEADWRDIIRPAKLMGLAWRSKVRPRTVWGTIAAWSLRFPTIHWWTVGSRRLGELWTFELLEQFWRKEQHVDSMF